MKKFLVTILLLLTLFLSIPAVNMSINAGIGISEPVVGQILPGSDGGGGGIVTTNGWCDSGPWWW